ncbi:MAG: preprotein translocase subunit SecA [Candidatus Zapsychrus exili]|nr:preprotein translocase subunit SecA [Candidatus Zapsychrus exili]
MFDFLIRGRTIKSAQKFINNLEPKVTMHLHNELPLPSVRLMKKMSATVSKINSFESEISKLTDIELKDKTPYFQSICKEAVKKEKEELSRLEELYKVAETYEEKDGINVQIDKAKSDLVKAKKKVSDDILPEAFAVVREVGKRVLNMRHFDVQMIGGMVLNNGDIAEMTTGEGKTLVATLPSYLNALTGEGVHVVTVNDYLAKRDCEWMGPIFEFLGLTIGVIQHDMMPSERKVAYNCDVTYGTNNEFGFDYLRDNMVNYKEDMVQRPHHFAVVDEVDSILVDEARTPLIISGPAEESTDKYYRANEIAKKLKGRRVTEADEIQAKHDEVNLSEGYDYLADEKAKSVSMTDQGEEVAAKLFGIDNLHDMETIEYRHHILQALKAREFFVADVDYVKKDGQVIIVDEFTGRMMPGRRWSDGLHQAVEAKEGIKIERENQTLATVTFQNYFRLYEKLSGMTGTAYTEATEFEQIYGLDCVVVPTNRKLQRANFPDCIYRSLIEKFDAVVQEIGECSKSGQPVLVGTISIERSETLSKMLSAKGITHKVLNAKYHEMEAQIISQAGRLGAVTIATNMAGRGTDIVLGGNAEFLAKSLAEDKAKESDDDKDIEGNTKKFLEQFRAQTKEEHEKVIGLGGLHVLGTERHESRRIDNQLRGRQGRQGDPGSSRFFVSLEDDLMRLFASDRIISVMNTLGLEEGQVLEHPLLSRSIEGAQRRVEGHNFEIRKHLLEYDNVMNRQREVIYDLRRSVLESQDVKDLIVEAIKDIVCGLVQQHLFQEQKGEIDWDIEGLDLSLKQAFNFNIEHNKDKLVNMDAGEIESLIVDELMLAYKQREEVIGVEQLRQIERMLLLNTIDSKWKDHLYAMDQLREGVGLRSFAQRDPLIEYKREGFQMFEVMYISINEEVGQMIFKIQSAKERQRTRGIFSSLPQKLIHNEMSSLSDYQAPNAQGASNPDLPPPKPTPHQNKDPKVGRNDPCPCGSGKKHKKCCGR